MTERQKQIAKLVRKNLNITETPDFIQQISVALNEKVSKDRLLEPETTDELRQLLGAGYKIFQRNWGALLYALFSKEQGHGRLLSDEMFQLQDRCGSCICNFQTERSVWCAAN